MQDPSLEAIAVMKLLGSQVYSDWQATQIRVPKRLPEKLERAVPQIIAEEKNTPFLFSSMGLWITETALMGPLAKLYDWLWLANALWF